MQYDAFISYARKDGAEYAERLDHDLVAARLRPWRDKRNLDPDQDFSAELEQAIEDSASVVCCITPDTHRQDSFVRREIGYALAVHKPVVPLIFEDSIPPIHIVNVTGEDFTHVPWSRAFNSLLLRLHRGDALKDQQHPLPSDAFRSYLNALYLQIIDLLKHTVFSEIALYTDQVEGAVSKNVRIALPVGFWHEETGESLGGGKESASIQNLGDAFSRYVQRVLLLGDPGAGKTTTLLAFARDRVAERLHDSTAALPIVAQISTWNSKARTPIAEWLATQVPMLDARTIVSLIQDKGALLLLDGLDELGKERSDDDGRYDPRQRFLSVIPDEGPVIVSCRSKDYAEIGIKADFMGTVTLKALSDQQIRDYLIEMPALWQALESDQALRDLARTPLLLAILTRAYRNNSSDLRALSNLNAAHGALRDKIFAAYVKSRFAHEQRHAEAELGFKVDDVYKLLGQTAVDGTEYIDAGHVEDGISLEKAIKNRLGDRSTQFKEQMLRLHLLIVGPEGRLAFIHALLRDHFGFGCAMTIVDNDKSKQVVERSLKMRALQFLVETDPERALEPLLDYLEPYIGFPIVYSLRVADSRVLLAYARSLTVDFGDAKYDVVGDAAADGLPVVANKLGDSVSARILGAAAQSGSREWRAAYIFALGWLRLDEGLDTIVSATQDEDPTVRGCAVYALASIGRLETADVVERLRNDQDPNPVKDWTKAPWYKGARVKDLANAALKAERAALVPNYFPSALYEKLSEMKVSLKPGPDETNRPSTLPRSR